MEADEAEVLFDLVADPAEQREAVEQADVEPLLLSLESRRVGDRPAVGRRSRSTEKERPTRRSPQFQGTGGAKSNETDPGR